MGALSHLECSACRTRHDAHVLQGVCTKCGRPLLARYDAAAIDRRRLVVPRRDLWRYLPLLPVADASRIVTLGEGGTPLLAAPRLGERVGASRLWLKDEGPNPTGTFKARGMAMAVTRARELGATALAAPSAGNAAGALSAYAARAGLACHVAMPRDVPAVNREECEALGAHVDLVDGLIGDAGKLVAAKAAREGWFDMATFKEPYRVEGKKTMGFEIWEDLQTVPDAIVYPTGGGTGLVGILKAFDELEAVGAIGPERPRLIAVQAAGCAPVVSAWARRAAALEPWPGARTDAAGLRVPSPFAGPLILEALSRTGGAAVAVTDDEMRRARRDLARLEGVSAGLEGAATVAALPHLIHDGVIDAGETVVCLNTGAAWKSV